MATVLVAAYGADPSTLWPEKYSSCFWNFTTGWTCQTVDAPVAPPPPPPPNGNSGEIQQPLGNTPDPSMLPVLTQGSGAGGCGCCGQSSAMTPVAGSPLASVSPTVPTATAAKKCGQCGYTNQEALFAIAVAFVFFLLVRK